MKPECLRAEGLAGAIALNEAGDGERSAYRAHIAACSSCRNELGGEHEIERTIGAIRAASVGETWVPALRVVGSVRRAYAARVWRLAGALAAFAAAVILGARFWAPVARQGSPAVGPIASVARVPAHPNAPQRKIATSARSVRHIVVLHHVVSVASEPIHLDALPPERLAYAPIRKAPDTKAAVGGSRQRRQSNIPVWRRNAPMPQPQVPAARTALSGRAESIEMAQPYSVTAVMPLRAIDPRVPKIAYLEGAQGTTAFEVHVTSQGKPASCTITSSSGYPSLDQSVCQAAMAVRYAPRLIDGRPTNGLYRDAFTFVVRSETIFPRM
jgi:TonB family protein